MTRVAVLGATGQLGSAVVRVLDAAGRYAVTALGHEDVECTDPASVDRAIGRAGAAVVVNCAAFVRVDDCEESPQDAFRVNALGGLYAARASRRAGARCVYVSTDYVFDGGKPEPYTEEDEPDPINVYGTSKLAGEHLVRQTCPDALIVRVAGLFGRGGARGKGGNFVDTMVRRARNGDSLRVVDDIRMSPTYAHHAAEALERLLRMGAEGIVHVVNDGACTWYEFARQALALAGIEATVVPVSRTDYPTKARRPINSALSVEKLRAAGVAMPHWRQGLEAYLADVAA